MDLIKTFHFPACQHYGGDVIDGSRFIGACSACRSVWICSAFLQTMVILLQPEPYSIFYQWNGSRCNWVRFHKYLSVVAGCCWWRERVLTLVKQFLSGNAWIELSKLHHRSFFPHIHCHNHVLRICKSTCQPLLNASTPLNVNRDMTVWSGSVCSSEHLCSWHKLERVCSAWANAEGVSFQSPRKLFAWICVQNQILTFNFNGNFICHESAGDVPVGLEQFINLFDKNLSVILWVFSWLQQVECFLPWDFHGIFLIGTIWMFTTSLFHCPCNGSLRCWGIK